MRPAAEPDSLRKLQDEIERFIRSLAHPVVAEQDTELFDLTAARWKLSIEFGKLLFEAWNPARSIACRVEEIAYRDRGRLGVFVRKPGLRATGTLEFRELERAERAPRSASRSERWLTRSKRQPEYSRPSIWRNCLRNSDRDAERGVLSVRSSSRNSSVPVERSPGLRTKTPSRPRSR